MSDSLLTLEQQQMSKFTPATQKQIDQLFENGGGYVPTKVVAGILRTRLKECFPGMKFKIQKGDTGSSVYVTISGGQIMPGDDPELNSEVTRDDVRRVVDDYVGGGFDGMTDSSYGHQHWLFRDGSSLIRHDGSPYAETNDEQNAWAKSKGAVPVSYFSTYIFVDDGR